SLFPHARGAKAGRSWRKMVPPGRVGCPTPRSPAVGALSTPEVTTSARLPPPWTHFSPRPDGSGGPVRRVPAGPPRLPLTAGGRRASAPGPAVGRADLKVKRANVGLVRGGAARPPARRAQAEVHVPDGHVARRDQDLLGVRCGGPQALGDDHPHLEVAGLREADEVVPTVS